MQDLLTAMVCGHMYHDRCIGAMSTAEKKHMRELTCCVCKTLNTPVDIGSKEFPLVLSPSPPRSSGAASSGIVRDAEACCEALVRTKLNLKT